MDGLSNGDGMKVVESLVVDGLNIAVQRGSRSLLQITILIQRHDVANLDVIFHFIDGEDLLLHRDVSLPIMTT